ncbi:MAG: hypothetical protein NTV89_13105 [Proteobacteria bacterium]|nr:hypothetical protein [Pseudomonadota bacterium]
MPEPTGEIMHSAGENTLFTLLKISPNIVDLLLYNCVNTEITVLCKYIKKQVNHIETKMSAIVEWDFIFIFIKAKTHTKGEMV